MEMPKLRTWEWLLIIFGTIFVVYIAVGFANYPRKGESNVPADRPEPDHLMKRLKPEKKRRMLTVKKDEELKQAKAAKTAVILAFVQKEVEQHSCAQEWNADKYDAFGAAVPNINRLLSEKSFSKLYRLNLANLDAKKSWRVEASPDHVYSNETENIKIPEMKDDCTFDIKFDGTKSCYGDFVLAKDALVPVIASLKADGIETVYLAGYNLGDALLRVAIGLKKVGFEVVILSDAVASSYNVKNNPDYCVDGYDIDKLLTNKRDNLQFYK
eukprot:574243_1